MEDVSVFISLSITPTDSLLEYDEIIYGEGNKNSADYFLRSFILRCCSLEFYLHFVKLRVYTNKKCISL